MKQFLLKILFFSLFFFVLDKAFIFIREGANELEVDRRLEKIINGEIQADVLIYGSSRGARSVIASELEDSIYRTCYNLSFPGSDITFHEYLLEETLNHEKNQKPTTVVLVVDDGDELKTAKSIKFRLDRLYPLIKYPEIRDELVVRKEKKPIINELLVTHQLNRSHFLFKQRKFTKNDSIMPCGSMPIGHQKKDFNYTYREKPYIYSKDGELIQKLRAFRAFVELCRSNNIELIVAISPNFRPVTTGFADRLEELTEGYGTVFVFDPSIKAYSDRDYFFDNAHLQKNGASIFTADLSRAFK